MDILREMQMDMGLLPRYKSGKPTAQKKEVPKITAWIFREGRRPELTVAQNTVQGFSKLIGAEDIEDITLSCGLAVICDAGNWWSEGEYSFCVGDVAIRGTVLIVGADEDGFKTIPREALTLEAVLQMCSVDACRV